MRWSRFRIAIFLLSLGFASGEVVQAQTIARKDAPYFVGCLKYSGEWADTIDFGHFSEWRIDSLAQDVTHYTIGSAKWPENCKVWARIHADKGYGVIWNPILPKDPFRSTEFRLMDVMWGSEPMKKRLLTIWQTRARDSIQLTCLGFVSSWPVINEIKKVLYFPDSSILLYAGSFEWDIGDISASDQFFRVISDCHCEQIYGVNWKNMRETKRYVLANRLYEGQYRISEITEFLTKQSWLRTQLSNRESSGTDDTQDGMLLDSAHIRVIDLWDLAKEKFGIDTTRLRK